MTMVELFDGLEAKSQNRWPSLEFDVGAINQLASPLLVAGFYYKTFMWPKAFWEKIYEPLIRKAAGLGRAVHEADPDTYEKMYGHCDLLVIGGGAAGLMAALTAARAGARVIIADEHARLGGALLSENETINNRPAAEWLEAALAELASMKEVTILPRTTVFGWFDGNIYGALERVNDHVAVPPEYEPRQRYWRIAAKAAILASGAEERPLVFGNNDRPGVMQASAIRGLANRYGVAAGKSVVVFTNNNSGYAAARDLTAAGVNVTALIDSRENAPKLTAGSVPVLKGAVVSDVEGSMNVKSVRVVRAGGAVENIACDAVAMSGGFSPVVHLSCHRGLKPVWNEKLAAFLPPDTGLELVAAGAAAGNMTLSAALADGAAKASKLLTALGFKPKAVKAPEADGEPYAVSALWRVESKHKAFVDFQNDVTAKDLPLAAREGYKDVELAKRYTTLGMATDQGKLSNVNGIALLAGATGKSIAQVGTTTFRPNYTPVSFGAFAGPFTGHHFSPVRKTPMHAWAEEQGAVFVEAGLWYRPQWFPREGESGWLESVTREVLATRNSVGVCDVSTLGKIDIQGPDAGEFLNRVYCNGWSTLEVGKARYGLMLREDGMVMDDGTAARLAEDHFVVTTTTAKAVPVYRHLEFVRQCLY
ncbi:MAG: FAD-dependent oxidoreductase, partial [Aestuariivirgaceae bacterium]|nr:FAD-dependent oxidoreductase [Aestuariivirgaceae bacterium]